MWLTPELRDHLVYWRNPVESGIIFGSVLVLLVAVKYVSLISVMGNLCLALVTSTVAFRIYKSVLTAINKSQDKSRPFQVRIHRNAFTFGIIYTDTHDCTMHTFAEVS